MRGFYWLIEGALAGCSRPGYRHMVAGSSVEAALDEDLGWLKRQGIEAVLSLTETPLVVGALERHGLAGLHLPVDDLTAPTPAQLAAALAFIDRHRALGQRVAVHCLVGQGRTGTVLAAYLIRGGLTPAEALRELRMVCPGAVENPVQERALEEFAVQRDWII
ncbi:MAG: dual specificity protein phosphatase family protein [Chloroflexota bacterium]|nr:dual specificity protein phosphatase family protein [Chloroflexota bacterium]